MLYKLLLAYDGTHYGGWQSQHNAPSIQALVEKALTIALRSPISIVGSGRTDAGVHALGQVAHFSFPNPIDTYHLLASLNGLLPSNIRIRSIESAPEDFHARFSATGKTYHYYLHPGKVIDPFKRLYSLHIPYALDLEEMSQAASLFVGRHDFVSFAHEAHQGSAAKDSIRTLRTCQLVQDAQETYLAFEGDGFLYKMVRNIVGTLLEVARGKITKEKIPQIFAAKDRREAPGTAPAHGLFLMNVTYNVGGGSPNKTSKDIWDKNESSLKATVFGS